MHQDGSKPTVDRWLLLFTLVPVITYAIYNAVLGGVQDGSLSFPLTTGIGSAAAEIKSRYLWASAFSVSAVVSLTVAAFAALTIWRHLGQGDRKLFFGIAIFGFLLIVLGEELFTGDRWYTQLGDGLYCQAFCGLDAAQCSGSTDARGACPKLDALDLGLDVTKYAGAAALIFLTLAFIATLRRTEGADPARELARAGREQQQLLLQGAAVYVMACLSLLAWASWPLAVLSDNALAAYREVLLGSTVLQGVGYSLGIASIFLPSAMVLRMRAADLVDATAKTEPERAEWLQLQGLEQSAIDQLRQMATILMPTFISFLPALQQLWGG